MVLKLELPLLGIMFVFVLSQGPTARKVRLCSVRCPSLSCCFLYIESTLSSGPSPDIWVLL